MFCFRKLFALRENRPEYVVRNVGGTVLISRSAAEARWERARQNLSFLWHWPCWDHFAYFNAKDLTLSKDVPFYGMKSRLHCSVVTGGFRQ